MALHQRYSVGCNCSLAYIIKLSIDTHMYAKLTCMARVERFETEKVVTICFRKSIASYMASATWLRFTNVPGKRFPHQNIQLAVPYAAAGESVTIAIMRVLKLSV